MEKWENGYMKTTIELPDQLFKRVKSRAAAESVKLKDYIARALEFSLDKPPASSSRFRIETPPIRLKRKKPIPAMTNAEMEEALLKESLGIK